MLPYITVTWRACGITDYQAPPPEFLSQFVWAWGLGFCMVFLSHYGLLQDTDRSSLCCAVAIDRSSLVACPSFL